MITNSHMFILASVAIASYSMYLRGRARANSAPSAFARFTRTLSNAYLLLWLMTVAEAMFVPAKSLSRLSSTSLYLVLGLLAAFVFIVIPHKVKRGLEFMFLVAPRRGEAPQGPLPTDKQNTPLTP